MTDQFAHAVATIRALPRARRDAVARAMLVLADASAAYLFPPDEAADVEAAEAAAAGGDVVPPEAGAMPPGTDDSGLSLLGLLPLHLAGPAADGLREAFRAMLRVLPEHPTTGLSTRRPRTWRVVLAPCPYALPYRVADGAILVLGLHPTPPRPAA